MSLINRLVGKLTLKVARWVIPGLLVERLMEHRSVRWLRDPALVTLALARSGLWIAAQLLHALSGWLCAKLPSRPQPETIPSNALPFPSQRQAPVHAAQR